MKNVIIILFIIFMIGCNQATDPDNNTDNNTNNNGTIIKSWKTLGNEGFSSKAADNNRIAIASDNTVYVAYELIKNQDIGPAREKIVAMKYNASVNRWYNAGSNDPSGQNSFSTSLAIDNNIPYIAYIGTTDGTKIKELKNGSWEERSVVMPQGSRRNVSITIGKNSIPYLSFINSSSAEYKTFITKIEGNKNNLIEISSSSKNADTYITSDKNGIIYVSYIDENDKYKAIVQKYNPSDIWNMSNFIALGNPIENTTNTSIKASQNGALYIVYADRDTYKLYVKKLNNSSWSDIGDINVLSKSFSIAIDYNEIPYIAYIDNSNGDKPTVKSNVGGMWIGGPISDSKSFSIDIAISKNNTPYVIYNDGNLEYKTVVKAYK